MSDAHSNSPVLKGPKGPEGHQDNSPVASALGLGRRTTAQVLKGRLRMHALSRPYRTPRWLVASLFPGMNPWATLILSLRDERLGVHHTT